MADLITHLCTGALPAALLAPRAVVPLCVGVTMPDLTGRAPQMLISILDLPLPNPVIWAFDVLHQPLPQTLLAGLFALAFHPTQQARVFGWTCAGVVLHFLLDVLQDHHGHGYYLAFPLSEVRWELGWIGSEATVPWAPWVLALTVVAWVVRGIRLRTGA